MAYLSYPKFDIKTLERNTGIKYMKTLILSLITLTTLHGFSAQAADPNGIQAHLRNIQNKVRACSVLPYTFNNGVKVFHHLISHCAEVHVLGKGKAKIKIGGNVYDLALVATRDTDGDIYHIRLRNSLTNEAMTLKNVPAYGDILLGILDGNSRGIPMQYVSGSAVTALDQYDHM